MADTQAEPKLLLPQLKPFYDFAIPLAWPVIRIACGWNLAVHGWGKVTRGPSAFVKGFADLGFEFSEACGETFDLSGLPVDESDDCRWEGSQDSRWEGWPSVHADPKATRWPHVWLSAR